MAITSTHMYNNTNTKAGKLTIKHRIVVAIVSTRVGKYIHKYLHGKGPYRMDNSVMWCGVDFYSCRYINGRIAWVPGEVTVRVLRGKNLYVVKL